MTEETSFLYTTITETVAPPLQDYHFAGAVFNLDAYVDDTKLDSLDFEMPVSVTIDYNDSLVTSLDKETLVLNFWDKAEQKWKNASETCVPPQFSNLPARNRLKVGICHLTEFAMFGQGLPVDANLTISKSINSPQASPGDLVTYTLVYSNEGPQVNNGVIITDLIPIELREGSFQASDPSIAAVPGVTFTWQVGTLEAGAGGIITITGVLTTGLPAGWQITNTAVIAADPDAIDDPSDNSSSAGVTVANVPPNSQNDAYNADEDVALFVPPPGNLGNDSDGNGDLLSTVLVSGPSSGALQLNLNGSFIYTPSHNFDGVDSFTYQADDGIALYSPTPVTITMVPENDAPTISTIPDQETTPDTPVGLISFIVDDPESSPWDLIVSATSSDQAVVADGDIIFGSSGATRTVTIAPQSGLSEGSTTITIIVSDGELEENEVFVFYIRSYRMLLPLLIIGTSS